MFTSDKRCKEKMLNRLLQISRKQRVLRVTNQLLNSVSLLFH